MTTGLANYRNHSVPAAPLSGGVSAGRCCCESEVAKYSVLDVANWVLTHEAMTHKKLQKLCYYAQAWYYALKKPATHEYGISGMGSGAGITGAV